MSESAKLATSIEFQQYRIFGNYISCKEIPAFSLGIRPDQLPSAHNVY